MSSMSFRCHGEDCDEIMNLLVEHCDDADEDEDGGDDDENEN